MDQWQRAGPELVDQAINRRESVLATLESIEPFQNTPAGNALMFSAVSRCIWAAWELKNTRLTPEFKHPIFSKSHAVGVLEINRLLDAGAADAVGDIVREAARIVDDAVKNHGIKIVAAAPDAGSAQPPAAPIKVEVVAMPARQAETVISRDGAGNIARSTQIERDI